MLQYCITFITLYAEKQHVFVLLSFVYYFFRQEILTLEYHLLQTAVNCQKHLVSIREWEQKRHSLSHISPLELSAASETFSAREDPNGMASALSPSPTEDSNTPSEEKHNGIRAILEVSEPVESKTSSLEGPVESSPNDESSIADVQVMEEGTESTVIGKRLSKPQLFIPTMSPLLEGGLAVTPDSGTYTDVPNDLPMEPLSLSNSREELATLVASKQRMEAQHCRLERRHQECRANMASIKGVLYMYMICKCIQICTYCIKCTHFSCIDVSRYGCDR